MDNGVKLDFGLTDEMLSADARKAWPYKFGLTYSVMLSPAGLETTMHVQNNGDKPFDFQVLFHTYLRINVSCEELPLVWSTDLLYSGLQDI